MLWIALQGLRGRKGPFAGAFVALAVASALVMACGTLLQAGLRSHAPVERYAAAPIVVAGKQTAEIKVGTQNTDNAPLFERARVSAALVSRIAAVPGVRSAIADVSVAADLRGPRGTVDGPTGHPTALHPWATAALTPYALRSGRPPTRAQELVVDAGLARRGHLSVGDRVTVASNGPAQTMEVVGVAATRATVDRQGVMFVATREAERLAAVPGRVDAIGVVPAPGVSASALAARLRHLVDARTRVVTGADRGEVEHVETIEAKEAVIAIGGTFGAIALLIAMFVVSSTIGLSVLQRRREVALLRAVAATPKQVRRMIAWEAVLVGLVASALGTIPGAALAGVLAHALVAHGVAPEDLHVSVGVVPALAAIASSVLTATIAVMAAGRRAARVRPTHALQESAAERPRIGPVRVAGGLLAILGSLALLNVAATNDDPSTAAGAAAGISMTLVIAVAFLGPLVTRLVAWPTARVLGRTQRVSGLLAASNMRTEPSRFASAITPIVLSVALSCTMLFLTTTREHGADVQGEQRVTADLVLQSEGAGIPQSAVDEARRTPGVATAVGSGSTALGPSLGATQQPLQAAVVDPAGVERVLDLDVRSGSLADMRDDTVALSESRARQAHATVGHRVRVVLGDGTPREPRLVATYRRGLGFGEVLLPAAMTAGHRTDQLADAVLIRVAPGASRSDVARRLGALSARYPGLTVGDRHDLAARVDANRQANDWLFRILVGIVFVFTAIAVVNTLLMIALHRTRELALLRLVGGTSPQIRAMARWEAGLIVALGLGLGGGISLLTLVPTSDVITGSPVPYAPAGLVVLVLGSSAALGFLGSQLATRLAMRTRPEDAVGVRV